VSPYQKGKTNLDFTEARDSEWQWHQLGHMQVCTSLQTDNHANTPPLSFLQAGCPSCRPTNSVKALKAVRHSMLHEKRHCSSGVTFFCSLSKLYTSILDIIAGHCDICLPTMLWLFAITIEKTTLKRLAHMTVSFALGRTKWQ